MSSSPLPLLLLVLAHLGGSASVARAAFAPLAARNGPSFNARQTSGAALRVMSSSSSCGEMTLTDDDDDTNPSSAPSVSDTSSSRRAFFDSIFGAASVSIALSQSNPRAALAAAAPPASSKPTSEAKVTDKIYIDLKGVPAPVVEGSSSDDAAAAAASSSSPATTRIVIGLFGEDAPQPVSILKQLVSKAGLPAECKPKETRKLQREQLEANKVYNACVESQERGVTYDLSNVWRIDKDVRIDVGSVSGKFVSRVSPNFEDSSGGGGSESGSGLLTHDAPGIVSVRRGDDGGFGFAIYPGGGDASVLNEDNVVVGKILEGMDVVARLNNVPVVQSSAVNYMALTGGAKGKTAPSRACRYGGPMYCNELKPLKKIQISSTGVL